MAIETKRSMILSIAVLVALCASPLQVTTPAEAGPFSWLAEILPPIPSPEDPHLYPEGSLLYDIWTCKGESDIGWVGVTQQFTDHDPYVVVVARTEFQEHLHLNLDIGIEIHAPRHNRIVAADRVHIRRNQDIAIFYHPHSLARLGGWGEYKAILSLDGLIRDEITFRLDQQETLDALKEEESQRQQAEEAFRDQFSGLEAKALLGEPDKLEGEAPAVEPVKRDLPVLQPVAETWQPEEWYRTTFDNELGKIIVFPKKPRKTWKENVKSDLAFRIRYYLFL